MRRHFTKYPSNIKASVDLPFSKKAKQYAQAAWNKGMSVDQAYDFVFKSMTKDGYSTNHESVPATIQKAIDQLYEEEGDPNNPSTWVWGSTCNDVTASEICYRDHDNDDRVVALDVGMSDEEVEEMLAAHPSYYRSTLDEFEACDKVTASDSTRDYKLGKYLGAMLKKFTVHLSVYGDDGPVYDLEESFSGSLGECLEHMVQYQKRIDSEGLDADISLEPWDMAGESTRDFRGNLRSILDELLEENYISEDEYDYYMNINTSINASSKPKYFANMVSASTDDGDYKYYVAGYYDNLMRGLSDNLSTDSFDAVLEFANELANDGCFIQIKNLITGSEVYYDSNVWLEAIKNGDVPEDVFEVTM